MREEQQWQRHQAAREVERSKIQLKDDAEQWQKIATRATFAILGGLLIGLYFLSRILG